MDTFSLIPGTVPENPGPLARFLPPLEEGVITTWLNNNIKPGGWLLDPFGTAPSLSLEAAKAGYRVLVAANNPITRFILEISASAKPKNEFNAAIADLAVSRKGQEKVENHIQALYLTNCVSCDQEIPAQAFLWRKNDEVPYGRLYECKECGEEGEKPTTPLDFQRASAIAKTAGLARARVLERIAPLDGPDREYAKEAIKHYLPRAVYALATLINRLDGLQVSNERLQALLALVLSACDQGNTLWPHPTERPRPKQLSTPSQFLEKNIWMALEEAIPAWAGTGEPVPCFHFSEKKKKLPAGGGILLYKGRIKNLIEVVKNAPVQAVIGTIPRPNQAFWTLSALWAGWLWGHETAETFRVALRRRRYDWAWQATALHSALHYVFELLPLSAPFFGLLAEPEPGFLGATLTAASTAGFDLRALAMRTAHDPMQFVWHRGERLHREREIASLESIQRSMQGHLGELGEPAPFFQLHAAGIGELAKGNGLLRPERDFDEALRDVQSNVHKAIETNVNLERLDSEKRSLDVGIWDLKPGVQRNKPLADRVERELVGFLLKNPNCTLLEIEHNLYPFFPELLTPSKALVGAVLDSYGVFEVGTWHLREEDEPPRRRADLEQLAELIIMIGERLGYANKQLDDKTYVWMESNQPMRVFYLLVSAITERILIENQFPVEKCLLVLPGGRASLLAYKEARDPRLRQQLNGWNIVKFRLIRALAEIPVLNRQTFEEQLVSDPIEQTRGQMMMF